MKKITCSKYNGPRVSSNGTTFPGHCYAWMTGVCVEGTTPGLMLGNDPTEEALAASAGAMLLLSGRPNAEVWMEDRNSCREVIASHYLWHERRKPPHHNLYIGYARAHGFERPSLFRALFLSRALKALVPETVGLTVEWLRYDIGDVAPPRYALSVRVPHSKLLGGYHTYSASAQPFRHALSTAVRLAALLPLEELYCRDVRDVISRILSTSPVGITPPASRYADPVQGWKWIFDAGQKTRVEAFRKLFGGAVALRPQEGWLYRHGSRWYLEQLQRTGNI